MSSAVTERGVGLHKKMGAKSENPSRVKTFNTSQPLQRSVLRDMKNNASANKRAAGALKQTKPSHTRPAPLNRTSIKKEQKPKTPVDEDEDDEIEYMPPPELGKENKPFVNPSYFKGLSDMKLFSRLQLPLNNSELSPKLKVFDHDFKPTKRLGGNTHDDEIYPVVLPDIPDLDFDFDSFSIM